MSLVQHLRICAPLVVLAISGPGGCSAAATPAALPAPKGPAAAPAPQDTKAQLVVAVVFDQLGADTLARHALYLDADGAWRTGMARGAYFPRAVYPQASTLTAPGHALLFTGAAPKVHGITANRMRVAGRTGLVESIDDGVHSVFGEPSSYAAPTYLLAPTVAEALKAHRPQARAVSLSLKDRGAILPLGKVRGLALWYLSASMRFTTSSYYGEAPPAFVSAFEQQHPATALLAPWTVPDPEALGEHLGPDRRRGEVDYPGFGNVFPHDPRKAATPGEALRLMPALSERLIDLAEAAVIARGLGEDDVPDLLMVSISGTDYAGHAFGPDSWEYFDHLRRADRALGQLVRRLQGRMRLAVLLTSDHGVAGISEQVPGASRLSIARLQQRLEHALDKRVARLAWVSAVAPPYLYFSAEARAHPAFAKARQVVCQVLRPYPGLAVVVDVGPGELPGKSACTLAAVPDAVREAVALSLHPERNGDFYLAPQPGVVFDSGYGVGTTHGSPWPYDRTVPVVVWGASVKPGRHDAPVDTRRVAPTLSRLLGSPPPLHATAEPLF